jgi:hypothetical protein
MKNNKQFAETHQVSDKKNAELLKKFGKIHLPTSLSLLNKTKYWRIGEKFFFI